MKEQNSNVGRAHDAVTVREAERSNSGRTLDVITAEIQQIERRNVFDIGKLLVEANKVCDHGDWLPWLKAEFEWSHDTAHNYMNAYRLATDYERVRNLTVPMRVIYLLADEVDEHTGPVVDALVEATAGGKKKLSFADAELVAGNAYQRSKYGDFPEAALDAMAMNDGEPWGEAAIAALKAARPTTAEEAEAIAESAWQAYKASLGDAEGDAEDDADIDADIDADAGSETESHEAEISALMLRAEQAIALAHFDGKLITNEYNLFTVDDRARMAVKAVIVAWTDVEAKMLGREYAHREDDMKAARQFKREMRNAKAAEPAEVA